MAREEEVRLIAYSIWEQEGCLNGRDCEHWFRAETIWEEQQKAKQAAAPAKRSGQRLARKARKPAAGDKKK